MPRTVLAKPGTPIRYNPMGPSSGSGEVSFSSLIGLMPGSGALSDPYDFGVGSRPMQYTWRARHKLNLASSYDSLNYYLVTSDDGVWWDANLGSGDRKLGTSQLVARDTQNVGALATSIDDSTPSGTQTVVITSGMVNIPTRYAAVLCWNDTQSSLPSGVHDHEFTLTPISDEIQ